MSPREMVKMTTASFDGLARKWVCDLERMEAARLSIPVVKARDVVARKTGVPAGTLEGLRRDRIKGVKAWVFEALRSAVIGNMKNEISRCAHELALARQSGLDPRSAEMDALESAMRKAEQLIGGKHG